MNMAKLRQILELRRATKAPPLLPPKKSKRAAEDKKGSQLREILDIHLKLRNFVGAQNSATGPIACAFSESEETQRGPWRVTAASELFWGRESNSAEISNVLAVEFQLERAQLMRLDICEPYGQQKETTSSSSSLGYCVFSVSELVCARGRRLQRPLINDDSGAEIAEALISCTFRPKPHSIVLQFAANNLAKKGSGNAALAQVFFEIHRMPSEESNGAEELAVCNGTVADSAENNLAGGEDVVGCSPKGSLVYRSEQIKWTSGKVLWRSFTLQSTDIARRELRLLCFLRDPSKSAGLPPLSLGEFPMHFNVLRRGPGPENAYFLVYDNNKGQRKTGGSFELCRLHEICNPSFLEYIAGGSFLNLAFAVDFSRTEGTVDETVVRHYVDDVEIAIAALGEPLREFSCSNTFAAFGLGAKIPPHFRESQEFCLNLDTDPHCRGLSGVLNAFKTSFTLVQPMNISHLSHVIYYVAKLAQNSLCRASAAVGGGIETDYNPPAYFVLVLITRGIFDDLKETVQAIIFASRAPLSIVFVGIGDDEDELAELERLATAGTRLNFHGRKPEREFTQYVSVSACRAEEAKLSDLKGLIAERGLATLGQQMCAWMMRNGYQRAPVELEPLPPRLQTHSRRTSPAVHPQVDVRFSSASLGAGEGENQRKTSSKRAGPRPLEGRGSSVHSLLVTPSPSSSCSSGNGRLLYHSSSSAVSSPSSSGIRTVRAIQARFRNLELDNFGKSLPGTPRRRLLPSTESLEPAALHQQNPPASSRTSIARLNAAERQHIFAEGRSKSTNTELEAERLEKNGKKK